MSYANQYFPSFSFTNFQTANPDEPPPGINLDSEFQKIGTTVNAVISNQKLLQRADGQLANGSVSYNQLSGEINLALNGFKQWVTLTAYVASPIPSVVFQGNNLYQCAVPHTSGTFATDLAAGKWILMVGATNPILFSFIQSTTLALARAALGSTTIGDALFTTASTTAARTSLGVGGVGNNVFSAATGDVARKAMAVSSPRLGDALNMKISQASNTTASVTYDEVILKSGGSFSGDAYINSFGSYTLNFANIGVLNGLDAGALAASTFYYIYAIANVSNGSQGVLASTSSSNPTLPSGYTYWAPIGVMLTDGSSHLLVTKQIDREVFYQTPITILNNLTPLVSSLTTQSVSSAVPPNARRCSGLLSCNVISAVNNSLQVAGDGTGTGLQAGPNVDTTLVTGQTSQTLNFRGVPLITAQTLFQNYGNTSTGTTNSLNITSFEI